MQGRKLVSKCTLLKVQTAILCNYVKHAVKSYTEDARQKVGKQVYIIEGSNCFLCNYVKHAVKSNTEDARQKVGK